MRGAESRCSRSTTSTTRSAAPGRTRKSRAPHAPRVAVTRLAAVSPVGELRFEESGGLLPSGYKVGWWAAAASLSVRFRPSDVARAGPREPRHLQHRHRPRDGTPLGARKPRRRRPGNLIGGSCGPGRSCQMHRGGIRRRQQVSEVAARAVTGRAAETAMAPIGSRSACALLPIPRDRVPGRLRSPTALPQPWGHGAHPLLPQRRRRHSARPGPVPGGPEPPRSSAPPKVRFPADATIGTGSDSFLIDNGRAESPPANRPATGRRALG